MEIVIRSMMDSDVDHVGFIMYEAFRQITEQHSFPMPFPKVEMALLLTRFCHEHASWFCLVAEADGVIAGSCIIDERDMIKGVGPISVSPHYQGQKVGRLLLEAALERCEGAKGVRLTQDTFNMASITLYARMGFIAREPVLVLEGTPKSSPPEGIEVRLLKLSDLDAANELCRKVHGIDRAGDTEEAIKEETAYGSFRLGRLSGYASAVSRRGHGVAVSEEDLQAIILTAGRDRGRPISFLLPSRQGDLLRWCLNEGFKIVYPSTLMTIGFYQEPDGVYFISSEY